MPVLDGLLGWFINADRLQLREWHGKIPIAPAGHNEHVTCAAIFRRHLSDLDRVAFSQRRSWYRSDALCLEREPELFLEIVVQSHRLFFRSVGIHDDLLVGAIFPSVISAHFDHLLRLKQLTDAEEAEEFLCADYRVIGPVILFFEVVSIIDRQVRFRRSEVFGLFEMLEIVSDFLR